MLATRSYFGVEPLAGDLLVPAVQKLSLYSQGDADSTNGSGGAADKSSEVAMVSVNVTYCFFLEAVAFGFHNNSCHQ